MNVDIKKYGPSLAVLTTAFYLGWPPEPPLDLGEDVVRAKAVRWKVTELDPPVLPSGLVRDPFEKVLVAEPQTGEGDAAGSADLAAADLPVGPSEDDVRTGLRLGGIAQTDGHRWAIINGRVCRAGESVAVAGIEGRFAIVQEILPNNVVVKSDSLTIQLRQQKRAGRDANASAARIVPTKPASAAGPYVDDEDDDADMAFDGGLPSWGGGPQDHSQVTDQ